ncbi:sodium:proton antiporter [Rivihabitans pingtungensis]|jgi:Na+/H+ antiporter NhaD/arsenite permease-like protein|uniref:sodium:proton antiporter n=1 Tax=Rivihabitans pingtungensis TaxID=1054498 RepID=UPI002C066643|nr:sodium:proton antiporter [Rivihabitans pingtungensis]HNX69821.1 sodium:proton antiporter [Rivihabitans pingtungensis]
MSRVLCVFALLCPTLAQAAGLNGAELSLLWSLPFAGLLLSIALFPIFAPAFWHHHFGKIALGWALAFLLPCALWLSPADAGNVVVHAMVDEYLPFIVLLFALYTISGGILITGNLHGSPALNTGILALGAACASLMGTTGAAMLLIRPLLRANDNRRHNVHVVVFFIFLVGNIGGGLTPIGDPPLFLGFLKGVSFSWTFQAMLLPVLTACSLLLLAFYLLDSYYYRKEGVLPRDPTPDNHRLGVQGGFNFLLLAGVVGAVLMSGMWKPGLELNILGVKVGIQNLLRDGMLLGLAGASLAFTSTRIRDGNEFNWDPIAEVGKLFGAIFITMAPAIAILRAGPDGALAQLVGLVSRADGSPIDLMYFWMTGSLSSFLDNAPTYLVFFNLASGDPAQMMTQYSSTLLAISAGAVFMGANSYIGNAPNFMIKAIAEHRGVAMPGFFGYMAWAWVWLFPLCVLLSVLFFL